MNELHTQGEWASDFDAIYVSYFLLFYTSIILAEKKVAPLIKTDKSAAKRILDTKRKEIEDLLKESGMVQKLEKLRIKDIFEDNFLQYDVVSCHLLEENKENFATNKVKTSGREMHLGKALDQIYQIALDPTNFNNENEQVFLSRYVV